LQDKFEKAVEEHDEWSNQITGGAVPKTRFVVWDLTPVMYADSMGLHLLEDTVFWCIKKGITLYVSNPNKKLVLDW
jgi:ABC-type transporter Mla MlaB component